MPDTPPDPLLQLAEAQVAALFELKRTLIIKGEALTKKNMTVALHAILCASLLMQKKKRAAVAKLNTRIQDMTDEEYIAHLEAKPSLHGVDVRREIGKCQTHFEPLGIDVTRARIAKWLNRADRNLGYNGKGQTSFAPKKAESPLEPAGWREWVRENATDPSNADRAWASLDKTAQQYIRSRLGAARVNECQPQPLGR